MNVIDKNGNLLNRGDTVKIDPAADSIKPLEFDIDGFQIVEQNGKVSYMVCGKYGDFPSEFVEKVLEKEGFYEILKEAFEIIQETKMCYLNNFNMADSSMPEDMSKNRENVENFLNKHKS